MNSKIEQIRTRQAELASQINAHRAKANKPSDELAALRLATQLDEAAKAAAQPKMEELTAQVMAELEATVPLNAEADALDKQAREIAFQLKGFDMQISRANSDLTPIISQLHILRQEIDRLEAMKAQIERQIDAVKAQRAELAPADYKPF